MKRPSKTEIGGQVFMGFEPSLTRTVLPACRSCGGAHVLASQPIHSPSFRCTCGAAPAKPIVQTFSARLLGIWGAIAGLFLSISRALYRAAYSKDLN